MKVFEKCVELQVKKCKGTNKYGSIKLLCFINFIHSHLSSLFIPVSPTGPKQSLFTRLKKMFGEWIDEQIFHLYADN